MKLYLFAGILAAILNGCYYDNIDEMHPTPLPCDTTSVVSFTNDILPIMQHGCGSQNGSCHQGDNSSSGYGLDNYTDVTNTINISGVFMETIVHSTTINSSKWMPKGSSGKIDDCSIWKIQSWIDHGTLNN